MYFEYPLGWKAGGAKAQGESLKAYTVRMWKHGVSIGNSGMCNQAATELFWREAGHPYYKVDDAAVELFRKINIDVPFKHVVAPFKEFCIRFSETNPLRTRFGPVRSMLMLSLTPAQAQEEAKYVTGAKNYVDKFTDANQNSVINSGAVMLFVDVGELDPNGLACMNYVLMHRCDEITVSESLKHLPLKGESELVASGIERDLLSIYVSVCFLSTSSDKILKPEVLSKDFAAYLEAERKQDTERIRVMTERAKRKGKIGWLVDGKRELVHSQQDRYEGEPTGRELRFRHVRSAHFRKKESGLVVFVRQCVVRKDLPAPS